MTYIKRQQQKATETELHRYGNIWVLGMYKPFQMETTETALHRQLLYAQRTYIILKSQWLTFPKKRTSQYYNI